MTACRLAIGLLLGLVPMIAEGQTGPGSQPAPPNAGIRNPCLLASGRQAQPAFAAEAAASAGRSAIRPSTSSGRPELAEGRNQTAPASAPVPSLSEVLSPIRQRHGVPALGAAAIVEGRLAAVGVVGVRKAGTDANAVPADAFHIGSCTKAMTATLIALLVEQGKLRWDLPLEEALPDLAGQMDAGYRRVTLRHLLAHRAGVTAGWPKGMSFRAVHDLPGDPRRQRAAFAAMVLKEPPLAKPGAKHIYSNAGYAVAGAVAERAADAAWEDLMRRMIFQPLGMTTAGFGAMGTTAGDGATGGNGDAGEWGQARFASSQSSDGPPLAGSAGTSGEAPASQANRASPHFLWQHRAVLGRPSPVAPGRLSDNPPAIAPAGTVHSSLGDWAKFVLVHLKGARGEPAALRLSPATFRELHTAPFGGDYALGWGLARRDWGGGTVLTHAGSNNMNYAVVWIAPKRNLAVLAAANMGGDAAFKACDEAAYGVIQLFLPMGQ